MHGCDVVTNKHTHARMYTYIHTYIPQLTHDTRAYTLTHSLIHSPTHPPQGLITNATLDRAVGNVLRQKFASGLFDNNASLLYVDPAKQAAIMDTPEVNLLDRSL